MVSLALVAELESLRFSATLGSTSQRLNLQVGQVVNRARDILRYNGSTFSCNASTSFRAESTLHGSFPKISHVIEMFCQKRFVKHAVVHMEKTLSSNENPLTQDEIICLAQVDFLSDDDEQQKQQNLLVITKLTFRIKTFL